MNSLHQTLRQLSRRRSASALSIGLLALGVALSVAFYSILDSALLRGLPFPDGDRLVAFSTREAAGWPMPLEDYRQIEEAQRSFDWTLPLRTFNTMVTRGARTQGLIGSYIPPTLFEHFEVEPILGRLFTIDDQKPDNPPVALISYRLWQNSYGGDPGILGEEILLNRERNVVVGVMPPGFRFPIRHDVWSIFGRPGREWEQSVVFAVGKLADDVKVAQARQDLARIASLLDQTMPVPTARNNAVESFVSTNISERAQGALRAMMFAALGLLALTCANLANLRLSESLRRGPELDTRLVLGSGPLGLVKLLLLENLALGVAATVLGLGLAFALIETLGKTLLSGGRLERLFWIHAELDFRAAGFAALCALGASLLGALAPIISTVLRVRSGRYGKAGNARTHSTSWSRGLVSLQVGLCFTLLVAAGLWGFKAQALLGTQPGFRADGLSSTQLSLYQADIAEPADRDEVMQRLQRDLSSTPGVLAVAFASSPPWGYVPRSPIAADLDEPNRDTAPRAGVIEASPDFFATLELDLHAGRNFSKSESTTGDVAIISRSLAGRLFAGDLLTNEAIGRSLTLAGPRAGSPAKHLRIVGIAADLEVDRLDDANRNLTVYLPATIPVHGTQVLIRRQAGTAAGRILLEDVLERTAPLVGTLDELSVDKARTASIWVERRLAQIFSLFSVAALLLTAGGIYAVIAVMVRSRERELGIRAAIGARPRDLQRLVLSESGRQLLIGLLTGVAALWLGSRLLDIVLVDGLELRPLVVAASVAVVGLACLAGSWGPTRKAAHTDPTRCLNSQ